MGKPTFEEIYNDPHAKTFIMLFDKIAVEYDKVKSRDITFPLWEYMQMVNPKNYAEARGMVLDDLLFLYGYCIEYHNTNLVSTGWGRIIDYAGIVDDTVCVHIADGAMFRLYNELVELFVETGKNPVMLDIEMYRELHKLKSYESAREQVWAGLDKLCQLHRDDNVNWQGSFGTRRISMIDYATWTDGREGLEILLSERLVKHLDKRAGKEESEDGETDKTET